MSPKDIAAPNTQDDGGPPGALSLPSSDSEAARLVGTAIKCLLLASVYKASVLISRLTTRLF